MKRFTEAGRPSSYDGIRGMRANRKQVVEMEQRSPLLEELLSDPVIRLVMKSDGVRAEDIRNLMTVARSRIVKRDSGQRHFRQAAITSLRQATPSVF